MPIIAVAATATATAAADTFTSDWSGCLHGEKAQLETTNVSLLIILLLVFWLWEIASRLLSVMKPFIISSCALLVQRQQQLSDTSSKCEWNAGEEPPPVASCITYFLFSSLFLFINLFLFYSYRNVTTVGHATEASRAIKCVTQFLTYDMT